MHENSSRGFWDLSYSPLHVLFHSGGPAAVIVILYCLVGQTQWHWARAYPWIKAERELNTILWTKLSPSFKFAWAKYEFSLDSRCKWQNTMFFSSCESLNRWVVWNGHICTRTMLRHEAFQLTGSIGHLENITLNVFSSVGDDSDSLWMQRSSALPPSRCSRCRPGGCAAD